MIKDYKISKHNSTVCGYPGRDYDWSKFCWDGSQIQIEKCSCPNCRGEHIKWKAPLPFTDGGKTCRYLHVPFDWIEDCTIFRVYPNETMEVGRKYRGRLVKSQDVVKKDDGWYWRLEF